MTAHLVQATKTFTLNTKAKIPAVALGTWKSKANDGYNSTLAALKAGYKHIDTAAIYLNEEEVGRAIKDSGVPRSELFITTKLWCTEHQHPKAALEKSLKRLGLEYVDLYIMHWPIALNPKNLPADDLLTVPRLADGRRDIDTKTWNFVKTWELMQELPATGLTRAVGVSNFSINNIKELLNSPGYKFAPAVNQVELHPYLPQFELQEFCESHGILMESYSPFGSDNAPNLKEQIVIDVAKKNNISPAQTIISWIVQRGIVVLPKSVSAARIASNYEICTLSDADMKELDNIHKVKGIKRGNSPDWEPFPTFV